MAGEVTAAGPVDPADHAAAAALFMDPADITADREVITAAVMPPMQATGLMAPVIGGRPRLIVLIMQATAGITAAGAIAGMVMDIAHTGGAIALIGGGHIPGGPTIHGGAAPISGDLLIIPTGRLMDITGTGVLPD